MPEANRSRPRTGGTGLLAATAVGGFVLALAVAFLVGRPGSWTGNPISLWLITLAVAIALAALVVVNRRAEANAAAAERKAREAVEGTSRMLERARLADHEAHSADVASQRKRAGLGF